MKSRTTVSSSRRKARKAHFTAPSHIRAKILSSSLSKDLRKKHGIRSMPIRKGDEVKILRGTYKNKTGKVQSVYRKKWCIHVEKITQEKSNGQAINVNIHPSNCVITNLNLANQSRKDMVARKGQKSDGGNQNQLD